MHPKLGVLDFNPIQYRAPLYQRLAHRGNIDLEVLFLSDHGYKLSVDPGFGVSFSWNIDLLADYQSSFLSSAERSPGNARRLRFLTSWVRRHDVVLIYGYANSWMLAAMAACRVARVPYLLRGEAHAQSQATGIRRHLRQVIAHAAVRASAGGLAIGELNAAFYRKYGARSVVFAPYSVDDRRFAQPPPISRATVLKQWGLAEHRPVVMFSGKLIPRKRPLDLAAAVRLVPREINTLFVGDGVLADRVRAVLQPGRGAVTGFVNQSELPSYYHAADVLVLPSDAEPWGLVVNEAMAAGVLPVVSDRVGAAPDLVDGVGEVYPCGDVDSLVGALGQALAKAEVPATRGEVRERVAQYSLDRTAAGFEHAVLAALAAPLSSR
jgi:glycosyltransferase involved in cell wall biosynthesis